MTVSKKQAIRNVGQTEYISSNDKAHPAARFWDRIAKRYAAKPVADQKTYERKLAITREHLHPEAEILELGCGTGSTALEHAPYVKHIRATDFSPKMIEIALEKALIAGINNVDFVCNEAINEGVFDTKYDMVLAHNVLHLLVDWGGTIKAAHRVLKPGGVFITSNICLNDSFAFMRLIASFGYWVGVLPQLSFFTRVELESAMSEAGFEIEHAWQPPAKKGLFLIVRKAS